MNRKRVGWCFLMPVASKGNITTDKSHRCRWRINRDVGSGEKKMIASRAVAKKLHRRSFVRSLDFTGSTDTGSSGVAGAGTYRRPLLMLIFFFAFDDDLFGRSGWSSVELFTSAEFTAVLNRSSDISRSMTTPLFRSGAGVYLVPCVD